jgi:hypothetical protein
MRVFTISLIFMASLAAAHAEDPTNSKPKTDTSCFYTLTEKRTVEVPVGATACFRSPPPYTDVYSLMHCFPPLQEIDQVKRGDSRCGDKYYEDREQQK